MGFFSNKCPKCGSRMVSEHHINPVYMDIVEGWKCINCLSIPCKYCGLIGEKHTLTCPEMISFLGTSYVAELLEWRRLNNERIHRELGGKYLKGDRNE